jgi:hypothetical protein
VVVVRFKDVRGVLFSDGEFRRVREIQFKLTRVLKEFNKRNSKYVAWLRVDLCSSFIYGSNMVYYRVAVRRRGEGKVSGVDVFLKYDPARERKVFAGIDGYWQNLDLNGVCEFLSDVSLDISLLVSRLIEVFSVA